MALYSVQKLFYQLNKDSRAGERFRAEKGIMLQEYKLSPAEIKAIIAVDLPTLYRMGVHPLLLRAFATFNGVSLPEYLKALSSLKAEPSS